MSCTLKQFCGVTISAKIFYGGVIISGKIIILQVMLFFAVVSFTLKYVYIAVRGFLCNIGEFFNTSDAVSVSLSVIQYFRCCVRVPVRNPASDRVPFRVSVRLPCLCSCPMSLSVPLSVVLSLSAFLSMNLPVSMSMSFLLSLTSLSVSLSLSLSLSLSVPCRVRLSVTSIPGP